MKTFSFEQLEVWEKSKHYTVEIYRLTHTFPKEEQFGLSSQMRRAAISVNSNIAEGGSRFSKKEQARFFELSYGSLMELWSQLLIAKELSFLQEKQIVELNTKTHELGKMISGLRNAALRNSG
jgi:four helix bundle protein